MEDILDSIVDAIHDFLVDLCGGIFIGIFDDANAATGEIAAEVGLTPSGWNASIFNMIQNLSNNVIIPIAGIIITFVLCYYGLRIKCGTYLQRGKHNNRCKYYQCAS